MKMVSMNISDRLTDKSSKQGLMSHEISLGNKQDAHSPGPCGD